MDSAKLTQPGGSLGSDPVSVWRQAGGRVTRRSAGLGARYINEEPTVLAADARNHEGGGEHPKRGWASYGLG